ncbi:MAG: YDG domain-containing protein, partial [bacterium]|nr:YDG domain-containing protein [bacterium]
MSKIFPTGSFRKNVSLTLITATIAFGCFLMPVSALAAATVTSASGGVNISIDKTSADGSGIYTAVSGPGITEQIAGDIAIGTHTITLPSGWEFDTSSTINIFTIGNIVLDSSTITPSPTSFSFVVTSISTSPSILGFSGLKVVPTGTAPSTGEMTYSGAGIAGVSGSTNFGTLSTVAGAVTQLAFTTQPGGAVYGSNLDPQPVVKTQDQFGNDSVSGLGASKIVALTLTSGTGALQGTASLDIGTGAGNGAATFTDLTVDEFGTGKQLTASADGLASDISSDFEITKKPITATLTVGNKTYDGTTAATITGVELVDVEAGDDVTVDDEGTATFDIKDVGEDKLVSSDGVIIIGADALNYIFDGTATGVADITPLGITITPTAGQTKVYGNADPIFAYTPTPALISPDTFFGVLSRVTGENVGIYDYTLGNLSAGDNYTLTFVPGTFEVTQRTLIVTATGINKVYDSSTTATVTLSDDRVDGDDIILGYTATFSDKNVANDKIVSVSSISITGGTDAGNYTLGNTTAATTADITSKLLIVSFTTDANKTYNGSVTAAITGRSLVGVIGVEDVDVTGGSATFEDKDIGLNRTVTATGFALTGDDAGNYIIGTINTTTGNVNPRPITITAVTDDRTYDGTTGSDETPVVTSSFSPPVAVVDGANFVQAYNNKNVGAGKILTPTGTVNDGNSGANYSYTFVTDTTGVITPKSINVTAQSDTKIYDGTDSSDETPVVGALETGDAIDTAPTQEYDTKDVGTDKTLTASGLVVNDGNSGDNYDIIYLPNGTGVINAKGLIVSGATTDSKTYDGDVNAIVDFDFAGLTGVVSGEELLVTLNSADYSAAFDNKNVNVGKTVTISGLALAGVGAGNYSLTQPVLTDGAITPATLIVTAEGTTKEYDSTLDATAIVTLSDNRVLGDDLTFGYTAAFTDKNVGDDKTVNVTGITITGGTDAGNYTLGNTTAATTADITPATLTATITVSNKTYDATIDATITGRTLIGVLGSDDVALNTDGIAMFADENVGTG